MWRPPLRHAARRRRSAAPACDAVLVRLEPVRSAEPPSISGSAAVKASSAIWLALRWPRSRPWLCAAITASTATCAKSARQLAAHAAHELGRQLRDARPGRRRSAASQARFGRGAGGLGVPGARRRPRASRTARAVQPSASRVSCDLVGAQRLAMRLGGAGAVRASPCRCVVLQMISVGCVAAGSAPRRWPRRPRPTSWPSIGPITFQP